MSWRRSLTWRLISRLVAAEILLLAMTAVVITTVVNPPRPLDVWYATVRSLLLESLTRDGTGTIRITPTPALGDYLAARPTLRLGAVEAGTGRVLPGSSLSLLSADGDGRVVIRLEKGPGHEGIAIPIDSPFGAIILVAFGGEAFAQDRVRFVSDIIRDIARYAAPALAAIAFVVWSAVSVTLAPLRAAALQARTIDFRTMSARLPDDARVPSELRPLVDAVNRALDRLQEDFMRQQRFTANAAHEMRTPLGILRARIDSLDDGAAKGELRRDAQRITVLVDQMLAIARLERNGARYDTIDLAATVGTLVADYAPLALDGHVVVEFEPPSREVMVRADARALTSAVGNLIDNALHVEPSGGVVRVAVAQSGVVLVSDHGPGIAAHERDLVFEPFWRRDESRIGSGLGLAIVREIASLHGGTVGVEETPGGGATFRLAIPKAPGH